MRLLRFIVPTSALLLLGGCHSAFVSATLLNQTKSTIPLIEVDYPSASFGTENLAPGMKFHYRFKVLGSGPVKVIYTDGSQKEKHVTGPSLQEGAQGPFLITFAEDGVHWQAPPKTRK